MLLSTWSLMRKAGIGAMWCSFTISTRSPDLKNVTLVSGGLLAPYVLLMLNGNNLLSNSIVFIPASRSSGYFSHKSVETVNMEYLNCLCGNDGLNDGTSHV